MELFFTGNSFEIHGVSHPGIPFLLDRSMREVLAVNDYLYRIAAIRGRTASPRTWRTYAESLYDFFSYLEANDLDWLTISQEPIAVWRNAMLEHGLARSTVNQRLRTVARFYAWAVGHRRLQHTPFQYEEVAVAGPKTFLAHIDSTGGRTLANALTLRASEKSADFLYLEQVPVFIAALRPKRNQLIAWSMLEMGLRREEAAGLTCTVLPERAGRNGNAMLRMDLDPDKTPTKGHKARWVQMSPALFAALWQYRQVERPRLVKRYQQQHGVSTDHLFLNRFGAPLSLQGINNAFSRAGQRSGVRCTPHMLRHTFGTYELLRLEKVMNQGNALLWVKERMGHSSIQTTMRYLHMATAAGQETLDDYQEAISSMMAAIHGG